MKDMTEQQLWGYIDGSLPEAEADNVRKLMARNSAYRERYELLLAVQLSLEQLETDEPSMGFTRNVMEAIAKQPAPGKLKLIYVDKRIVFGIVACFMLLTTVLLTYAFLVMNREQQSATGGQAGWLTAINYSGVIQLPLWEGFLFADIIIGLYLFEGFLRRKLRFGGL